MRLDEFPLNTKVHRECWVKHLYLIMDLQGVWRYMKHGELAGRPSKDMLGMEDFKYYEKQEKVMANVNFVGGEYNVVKVELSSGGCYNYKIAASIPIEEHDLVVVHSSNGLGLARIKEAFANNFDNAAEVSKATAWVVNVVDETDHKARIKATEKREYLVKQLEERKEAMEATQVYEMLSAVDPIAKKLLKQLKKLV